MLWTPAGLLPHGPQEANSPVPRYRIKDALPDHAILPGDVVDDDHGAPILIRKLTLAAHQAVRHRAAETPPSVRDESQGQSHQGSAPA